MGTRLKWPQPVVVPRPHCLSPTALVLDHAAAASVGGGRRMLALVHALYPRAGFGNLHSQV